jgi:hypothetical protein
MSEVPLYTKIAASCFWARREKRRSQTILPLLPWGQNPMEVLRPFRFFEHPIWADTGFFPVERPGFLSDHIKPPYTKVTPVILKGSSFPRVAEGWPATSPHRSFRSFRF